MKKISVHILDTRNYSFDELLNFTKISKDEISFLNDYHSLDTKKEKLISYYFKKKYVGEWFLDKNGKPLSNNIHFNISDSKGVVAIALSRDNEVGIDIEVPRPVSSDLINHVCSEEEIASIKNNTDFFIIWTNKEALVKCLGTGIENNLKLIPALQFSGKKTFRDEAFYSKTICNQEFVMSITLQSNEDFNYELIIDNVKTK